MKNTQKRGSTVGRFRRYKVRQMLLQLLTHAVLLSVGFVTVMPFLWSVTTALKLPDQVYLPPYLLPAHLEWRNFADAWETAPFGRFYLNSTIVAVAITTGQVLFCSLAGYAFARLRFPGRDLLFFIVLGTMMVPTYVTVLPAYLIVSRLGWIDTYQALIVPGLVSPFGIFLMRQWYLSISTELDEAALIDGASRLTVWWRILLPLSQPALVTLGLFAFLWAWNDFMWPLVATRSVTMRTIQVGLATFQQIQAQYNWTLLMAGTVTATIPGLIFFLLAQRRLIPSLATTGLKG